jgi:hypothetical protein
LVLLTRGWKLVRAFFHNLAVAFLTYKHAVFFVESTTAFRRDFLTRKPFLFLFVASNFLSALRTVNISPSSFFVGTLDNLSILKAVAIKLRHNGTSPFTGWLPCPNPSDCQYVLDGKYTGIIIQPRWELYSPNFFFCPVPTAMKLRHPVYSVYSFPEKRIIIESPSFKEAKQLAEWYYNEWLKVNHNLINKQLVSYPSTQKGRGIENENNQEGLIHYVENRKGDI